MNKHFTVNFLFSEDLSRVLLLKKKKTAFAGRLNGCGGEIEDNETPYESALREINEETGVPYENIMQLHGGKRLTWLGRLSLPYNCKYPSLAASEADPACVLEYFAGILSPDAKPATMDENEPVGMYQVNDILTRRVTDTSLAGDGDVPLFVNLGIIALNDMRKD